MFSYHEYFLKDLGSESPEGVFIFENLTHDGYRLGPRDKLDEEHIMLLTRSIAEFHAVSYAVKIQNKKQFDQLVSTLKIIPFHKDAEKTMFRPLYDIALERVYRHIVKTDQPEDFKRAYLNLYEKFKTAPEKIFQICADGEDAFNLIIHGDYNRNNVMFRYKSPESFEFPVDLKMFDFQWVKYASPVLDLSFYLYMNLDPEIMECTWDKVLKFYHETLISSLMEILNCSRDDERLQSLNFEDFLVHFSKHAFYGCFISAHFLPIMLCDVSILPKITNQLMSDFFSEETKEICIPAGGELALSRVLNNLMHAYKKGYLDPLISN